MEVNYLERGDLLAHVGLSIGQIGVFNGNDARVLAITWNRDPSTFLALATVSLGASRDLRIMHASLFS